jgi:hypothetical protein
MGRAAQPHEIAPSYVFFAAPQLSSYYSGEALAPVGEKPCLANRRRRCPPATIVLTRPSQGASRGAGHVPGPSVNAIRSLVSERRQTPVRSRAVEEYALVFISVCKA